MSASFSVPHGQARFRLWLWTLLGLFAVAFWSGKMFIQPFHEPPQVAVVGHDAPWRTATPTKKRVAVGTDRKHNDITLYDRKASPEHFVLEQRGGGKRWWAVLYNRSQERAIEVRRSRSPQSKIQVNRYALKDKDRFLVPIYAKDKGKLDRPQDPCSPESVTRWLRGRSPEAPKASRTTNNDRLRPPTLATASQRTRHPEPQSWVALEVQRQRIRWSIRQRFARMTWGTGNQRRIVWLDQHRRYKIPKDAGGGLLEYRYNQWQVKRNDRWSPWVKPMVWGKPKRHLEQVRRPGITTQPLYRLGLVSSPCRWTLKPSSIPAGINIGRIARLSFRNNRLFLQHVGHTDLPLQIVPHKKSPRLLGTTKIYAGDSISVGQLTYRVSLTQERVRMMLTRLPHRYIPPLHFFGTNASEQLTMRHWLRSGSLLLLTGGEGSDAGTERWRIPLPLAGTPGQTRLSSPYAPFLTIKHLRGTTYEFQPLGKHTAYKATREGKLLKQPIRAKANIQADGPLLYIQRLYLRIFQPNYGSVYRYMALLWLLIAGGAVLLLHHLIEQGHVRLAPFLSVKKEAEPIHTVPEPRWGAFLWLWPIALFLNGLGLFVLATLSLSSLGLNNSSFLYRQFLWSLVGVVLFVFLVAGGGRLWSPLKRWLTTRLPSSLREMWQSWFPPSPQGVVRQAPLPSTQLGKSFWVASGTYGLASLISAFVFGSFSLFVVAMLLYGYVLLLHREYQRQRFGSGQSKPLHYFFLTLILLGTVPLVSIFLPFLVHNRFFLVIPGLGTVKLSEFASLSAILFFAHYLGHEIFTMQQIKRTRAAQSNNNPAEASTRQQRWERLGGAMRMALLYLFLLGAIGVLYTAQGDLGPGLILTCCFSLFLLFAFLTTGADRLTTFGNLLRIATVFAGFLVLLWLPDLVAWLFPDWAMQNSEFQKVRERLSLWNQPWRFVVGEQIIQNLWNLSNFRGTFQWFNNLHSDFVLTAVVRVLSPLWGVFLIVLSGLLPILALRTASNLWTQPQSGDAPATLQQHRRNTVRALLFLFGGIYLFAQNFIHVGSVLRLTPMTGVTFTWVSSGGTSLIVCYGVLALMHRQLQTNPTTAS